MELLLGHTWLALVDTFSSLIYDRKVCRLGLFEASKPVQTRCIYADAA